MTQWHTDTSSSECTECRWGSMGRANEISIGNLNSKTGPKERRESDRFAKSRFEWKLQYTVGWCRRWMPRAMVPTFTCNNNHNFVIINYSKHPKWFVVIVISTILSDEKCDYILILYSISFSIYHNSPTEESIFSSLSLRRLQKLLLLLRLCKNATPHRVSDIHFTVHCSPDWLPLHFYMIIAFILSHSLSIFY